MLSDTLSTLKAAWPVLKQAIASGQLWKPQCELVEPHPDINALYDVEIPISEGFTLTANIYRSRQRDAAGETSPVVMCAHPYDNHLTPALNKTPLGGPPQQYRLLPQSGGIPKFSTLTSWESPDPNFWVPAGYTLVNLNLPGFANSGGPASILSRHQGKCFREAITWVGEQNWCTGDVGLCGVSFLCISQYLAASTPDGESAPEALKCIIPWEGVSDLYQDLACRGGVSDTGFLHFWWHTEVKEPLNNTLEAYLETEEAIPPEILSVHPFYDNYWKAKAPPLQNIRVPMLLCASFSDHELHTFGSFRAYEKASSTQKWLYTHRSGKWAEFYKPDVSALQKEFMDHFLKGAQTRFSELQPVRIEVRSSRDVVKEVRWEDAWPLTQTESTPLFLQPNQKLGTEEAIHSDEVTYDGASGKAEFEYAFPEDTEVTGYIKLKVWLEARGSSTRDSAPNDLVMCCFVDKRDKSGKSVRFYGAVGQRDDMVTRGYGCASRRELNIEESSPLHPVLLGTKDEFLSPGDVVPVEIAFCPSSTFFAKGERLRLIVSARDIVHAPIFKKDTSVNRGRHVLHFGGQYDSHLLIPKIRS
ncbi:MAG: CocE/NonD family hydrolase [Cyanobacteria bacterium J06627_32]